MMYDREHIRGAYDAVAQEYAHHFGDELARKPLDCDLLKRFAERIGEAGLILDLGCGPGQTTGFLDTCGTSVCGVDLSPQLLNEARRRYPHLKFVEGDMLALPFDDNSAAGVVAFYAIVHFGLEELQRALEEMHRVLMPGGRLLMAFHVGEETVGVEDFLGKSVSLEFVFFSTERVSSQLESVGFLHIEVLERDPYRDMEYPSRRAYISCVKAPIDNDHALPPLL